MHRPNGMPGAAENPLDVHQATHVASNHGVRPGIENVPHLVLQDSRRDVAVPEREAASETAAPLGVLHFHELHIPHPPDQLSGLFAHAETTQQITGIMIGDLPAVSRSDIFDPQHVHQVFGQLENPPAHGAGLFHPPGVVPEQFRVSLPNHGHAGPGWADNGPGTLEGPDEMPGRNHGFLPVPGLESRLAAARLAGGTAEVHSQSSKYPDHGLTHFGVHAVDDTRNEQRRFFTPAHGFPAQIERMRTQANDPDGRQAVSRLER